VIAAVAGKPVRDGHELIREVMMNDVGQAVQLEILRGGKRYGASVTLTARPEPPVPPAPAQQRAAPQAGLGMSVRDTTPQQSQQMGLSPKPLPIITAVVPGSAADRAGLRTGDVIVEVDGIVEPSAQQLQQAAGDGQLLLRVRRKDASFYAALRK
jgi:serine protease Do